MEWFLFAGPVPGVLESDGKTVPIFPAAVFVALTAVVLAVCQAARLGRRKLGRPQMRTAGGIFSVPPEQSLPATEKGRANRALPERCCCSPQIR